MRILWDTPITVDDGLVLRCNVYLPEATGRYPVIMTYGPYGKGLAFQEGFPERWELMVREHPDVAEGSSNKHQAWETVDPEKWTRDGYACVRVDSRGAGRSPGYLEPSSPREVSDLYACIEWASAQEWSSGKVGLNGISYYATIQWKVAAMRPPHLYAICPWEGCTDWYRDQHYHGGILSTFTEKWYPRQVSNVQHGVGSRGPKNPNTGEYMAGPETLSDDVLAKNRVDSPAAIAAHPLIDDYVRARTPDLGEIAVPILSCANWGGHGLHTRGNFEGFMRARSEQKWLEVHGLQHWVHFYTDYGRNLQRRFFDHFLKGQDNGWDSEPAVRLQIRNLDGTFDERTEGEWPIARTDWTRYYLNASDSSLKLTNAVASSSVTYQPLDSKGVTFRTDAFPDDVEITGPLYLKLFVSSESTDADIFAILRIFNPEGDEVTFQGTLDPHVPAAMGWLRASHRALDHKMTLPYRPYHLHESPEPLSPGEVVQLDVELWPTCFVLPAGHRLGLTVRGDDYTYGGRAVDLDWHKLKGGGPFRHDDPHNRPPDVFGAPVTLHTGQGHGSFILLPIIP